MLAKVIAWGPDRAAALRRLDVALARTAILGVYTNTAFLRRLLQHPQVVAGNSTPVWSELTPGRRRHPEEVTVAAALIQLLTTEPAGPVVDLVGGAQRLAAGGTGVERGGSPVAVGRSGVSAAALRDAEVVVEFPDGTDPQPRRASAVPIWDELTVTTSTSSYRRSG